MYADKGIRGKTDMGWGAKHGPWHYTKLTEPFLTSELTRLSLPKTEKLSSGVVDSVSFQAAAVTGPESANQDRYIVEEWDIHGSGKWTMIGVFDGHAGHETVDYTVEHLPNLIRNSLSSAISSAPNTTPGVEAISTLLTQSMTAFDDSIANDVFAIFPGGPDEINKLSDDEIQKVVREPENAKKLLRCMRGTTALVTLFDPSRKNLWVASLGDCLAVLGSMGGKVDILSTDHNASNPEEAERVKREHPGEEECVLRGRVLGAIAITRAIGDHLFKLPAIYTSRVFLNASEKFQFRTPVHETLSRNFTPPYLSNISSVKHIILDDPTGAEHGNITGTGQFLILSSDGLPDCHDPYMELKKDVIVKKIVDAAMKEITTCVESGKEKNIALTLLRDALGGDDAEKVSRTITVEMEGKYMDDMTVVVLRL